MCDLLLRTARQLLLAPCAPSASSPARVGECRPADQLPRLACILLARQGVQAGDWALSLSQEDSSDSDSSSQPGSPSQGPFKVFARDTDLVLAAQHAPSTLTFRE